MPRRTPPAATGTALMHRRVSRSAIARTGVWGSTVIGCAVIALPPWLVLRTVPWMALATLAGVVMLASLANAAIELRYPDERSREWTGWRFLLSFAAGGAVLGLEALGRAPLWDPRWPPVS